MPLSGRRAAALSLILSALLAALCLSTAALATGRGDGRWAVHTRRDGYRFDAGWLGFKTSAGGSGSLKDISPAAGALGLAAGAAQAASALLAAVYAAVTLCGVGGPHIAAAATPASLILAALQAAYWAALAITGSSYMKRSGAGGRFVPWPGPAWGAGMGAAAAWAAVALLACCVPAKRRGGLDGDKAGDLGLSRRPSSGMGVGGPHHTAGVAGGALAAPMLTAGIGLHRTRSGGGTPGAGAGGLGPPRLSGPSTAAPFTAGMDPADAAALGARPAGTPPPAPEPPVLASRVPTFHGPSRVGGDLPPRDPPPPPQRAPGPLGALARRLSRARSGEEGGEEGGGGAPPPAAGVVRRDRGDAESGGA